MAKNGGGFDVLSDCSSQPDVPAAEWAGIILVPAAVRPNVAGYILTASFEDTAHELDRPPERFDTRPATEADIPTMVEIDLAAFRRVYEGQGKDEETNRRELTAKFTERFSRLGGDLMPVVIERTATGEEQVVGFAHFMRTDKGPDEFVSWEDTTSDGWLTGHNPNGRYMYVATLTMSSAVARTDAPLLLAARARGLMVLGGCELIYSESRLPNLRKWVQRWCTDNGVAFEELSDGDKFRLAQQYVSLSRYDPSSRSVVPHDSMLAFCVSVGNIPTRLVAGAYDDAPSMNFGVVCVIRNPLSPAERTDQNRQRVGRALMAASHSLERAGAALFE